jgi:hypothetical protein
VKTATAPASNRIDNPDGITSTTTIISSTIFSSTLLSLRTKVYVPAEETPRI